MINTCGYGNKYKTFFSKNTAYNSNLSKNIDCLKILSLIYYKKLLEEEEIIFWN